MKYVLAAACILSTLCASSDETITERNGIKKLDCDLFITYKDKAANKEVYFFKDDKSYYATEYQDETDDRFRRNPVKFENPDKIYQEIEKRFEQ